MPLAGARAQHGFPGILALTLCLITDRRRLAAACGLGIEESEAALLEQIAGAIAGGVDVVQLREPDLAGRDYLRLVRRSLNLAAPTRTRIIVNDRADVAIAGPADGLHLRETSVATSDVRRLLPGSMLVGRSVHDAETARHATDADYLIGGTVFETRSKPELTRPLGLEGLAAIVVAAGDRPVWAVGGVTGENAAAIRAAGARGVAAIGAFIPRGRVDAVRTLTEELTKLLRFSLTRL